MTIAVTHQYSAAETQNHFSIRRWRYILDRLENGYTILVLHPSEHPQYQPPLIESSVSDETGYPKNRDETPVMDFKDYIGHTDSLTYGREPIFAVIK